METITKGTQGQHQGKIWPRVNVLSGCQPSPPGALEIE